MKQFKRSMAGVYCSFNAWNKTGMTQHVVLFSFSFIFAHLVQEWICWLLIAISPKLLLSLSFKSLLFIWKLYNENFQPMYEFSNLCMEKLHGTTDPRPMDNVLICPDSVQWPVIFVTLRPFMRTNFASPKSFGVIETKASHFCVVS